MGAPPVRISLLQLEDRERVAWPIVCQPYGAHKRNGLQAMALEFRMPHGVMRDSCCTYLPMRLQVQESA